MVGPICARFPSVVRAPSVEVCGTGLSGLVGSCCFSGVVCTTTAPGVNASVLGRVLGLVAGEWVVWEVEDIKAGDIGAKLALVAGTAGSVEDPIKAGDQGVPGGRLIVTALVGSVGRDTRPGDFSSVMAFSGCRALWFWGSAVWLPGNTAMADSTVDIWTDVTRGSLALWGTRVEDERGKVACETECGARVDTVKETGKGDGEDDEGVAVSEVDFSCCVGDPVDGKVAENRWGGDTEGRGQGASDSDGSSADLVLASRTWVFGIFTVDAEGGRLEGCRTSDSVED